MKYFIGFLFSAFLSLPIYAQTKVEKMVPIGQSQSINFDFTRPELITIRSWAGKDIKLTASVEINKGENDNAFKFEVNQASGQLTIRSLVEGYKNLPKKILIHKNGQDYIFNTDDTRSPEIKKFKEENGESGYDYMSIGVIVDISVEIFVPENAVINVYSKFGLVEILDYKYTMTVESKFGGIDLSTSGSDDIEAGTKFGEKYTNLNNKIIPLSIGTRPGKWDKVKLLGTNSSFRQELQSEFGNIYIRKM